MTALGLSYSDSGCGSSKKFIWKGNHHSKESPILLEFLNLYQSFWIRLKMDFLSENECKIFWKIPEKRIRFSNVVILLHDRKNRQKVISCLNMLRYMFCSWDVSFCFLLYIYSLCFRSSYRINRVALWKKVFLKISQNSQENTCVRVSFLIKLQALACNYIKKKDWHRCFLSYFARLLREPFLQNTPGRLLLFLPS